MIESQYNRKIKVQFFNANILYTSNPMEFPIEDDDLIIVNTENGEEIGRAIINPAKYFEELDNNLPKIVRKATPDDVIRLQYNQRKEKEAMIFCERKVEKLELEMKLINTFFQFDRKKLTFYFTADNRIDFRELVKVLAGEFKTRIEMRQINPREEVRLVDGIGSCGRKLCCHNHLEGFSPVTTQIVKEQNLPMNPSKISGCCGKLKCCYLYEYEEYRKVLNDFPEYGSILKYEKKKCVLEKIDIYHNTITIKFFDDDSFEDLSFKDFTSKVKVIGQPLKKESHNDSQDE